MSKIFKVFNYWRYWVFKALYRLRLEYKQTLLGLIWEPFSLLFVTFSIAFIWAKVLNEDDFLDFFLYVLTGYYIWGLLSTIVLEGVKVFEKHIIELTNENRSLLFYIFEELSYSLAKFILVYPLVLVIIVIWNDSNPLYASFLSILPIFAVILAATGFMIIFGTISLFYMDIRHVIQSVMRLAFLLTPIIWRPERLGEYASYIWLNPFYVYIQAIREAMLLGQFSLLTFSVLFIQSLALFVIGFLALPHIELKVRTQVFNS